MHELIKNHQLYKNEKKTEHCYITLNVSFISLLSQTVKESPDSMSNMYPDIFDQLLTYVDYGVRVPKFGKIETKQFGSVKGPTVCATKSNM